MPPEKGGETPLDSVKAMELTVGKLRSYANEMNEALERVNKAGLDANEELTTLDKSIAETEERVKNREADLRTSLGNLERLQETLTAMRVNETNDALKEIIKNMENSLESGKGARQKVEDEVRGLEHTLERLQEDKRTREIRRDQLSVFYRQLDVLKAHAEEGRVEEVTKAYFNELALLGVIVLKENDRKVLASSKESEEIISQLEKRVDELEKQLKSEKRAKAQLEKRLREEEEEEEENNKKMVNDVRETQRKSVGTKYCLNTTIENFRACDNVESVFDIESVMKQPLEDVGEGIRMSEPVDVELNFPKTGNIWTANISHNGIVAIYYYNRGDCLQLTNLFTKQQAEFKVEAYIATAFYDNKIIVMTCDQKLREAPVDSLFTTPSTDTLKVIGSVKLFCNPPNTLTQETRRVYYGSSNDLYEYNVDTRENSKIDMGHRVWYIASSGGIDMGVKCVFRDLDDKKIYALNMDNIVECVNDGDGTLNWFTNIFPSSDTPDLSRALYKMDGKFVYKNRKVNLECPVRFNEYYTTVRLYKDVFLAYDKGTKQWKMLRIQVP